MNKKDSARIAQLINTISVGERYRAVREAEGDDKASGMWLLGVCEAEVALYEEFGICLPGLEQSRRLIAMM